MGLFSKIMQWASREEIPAPIECPATRQVKEGRSKNFVTMTRLLMAEMDRDNPVLRRVVGR